MTRRWIWASLAISTMWVAVLFASVFGGDIVVESVDGDNVTTPVGAVVAVFAGIATIVVAAVGFRGESADARRPPEERRPEPAEPAEPATPEP